MHASLQAGVGQRERGSAASAQGAAPIGRHAASARPHCRATLATLVFAAYSSASQGGALLNTLVGGAPSAAVRADHSSLLLTAVHLLRKVLTPRWARAAAPKWVAAARAN